jgi:NedA-like, galactose-binding domain
MVTSKLRFLAASPQETVSTVGPELQQSQRSRLAQAKLFAELARRTESPFDALPSSDASIALALLWKEAAFWALSALGSEARLPEDLGAALKHAPPEVVLGCAGGAEWLSMLELALQMDTRGAPAEGEDLRRRNIATLSTFTRALIRHLEAPALARERLRFRRIVTRAGAVLLVLGISLVAFVWVGSRWHGVMRGRMTTSSDYAACRTTANCGNSIFHTNEEDQPWVMYDLGKEVQLHSIDVENRSDCCYGRAVPLVVETGNDAKEWKEQARVERTFSTWSAKLRTNARYVRLRVDRNSILHLGAVVIR